MHERCGDMQFKMPLRWFRLPVFSSVVEALTFAVDIPDLGALPEKEELELTIKSPISSCLEANHCTVNPGFSHISKRPNKCLKIP